MTSLRHRTLWLVLALLVLGTLTITLYNFHDSSHEITEIYDAQLAQSARLLQGIVQMPLPDEQRQQLYEAFNTALSQAGRHRVGHPYEGKMAFQVWDLQGKSLVRSASAPVFDEVPGVPGFAEVSIQGVGWHGFLLPDEKRGLRIWVGERDDVRQDLVDRIVRHTLIPNLIGLVLLAVLVWQAVAEHGTGHSRPARRVAGAAAADSAAPGTGTDAGRAEPAAVAGRPPPATRTALHRRCGP